MNSGGAERVASALTNAWADRGDSVTLCLTFSGRGECFYNVSKNVRVVYLNDLVRGSVRGVLGYCRRFVAMRRLLESSKPDFAISFLTNVNVAVILTSIGLNIPVVVSERSYPPHMSVGFSLALLRRLSYPYASRVVMLTKEGNRWLKANLPKCNGGIIPNPVAFPLAAGNFADSPIAFGFKDKVLLAVGRLDGGKQFDLLIRSFAGIASRFASWNLVIIGEGPDRAALERQLVELEVTERVFLLGKIGRMGDWYARADLYVMTSRFEGFPNTLAEAMAHGCAAVSYDCDTGPRDIIRHEIDGLLVSPVGDVRALSAALERLMSDEAKRKEMAGRAIEVRERYSLERILSLWDQLFDDLTVGDLTRRQNS